MTQTTGTYTASMQQPSTTAAAFCAASAFILYVVHTLSLALGVLLIPAVVLCGVLISLALTRRIPQKEHTR